MTGARSAAASDIDRRWYVAAIGALIILFLALAAQTWDRTSRSFANDLGTYVMAADVFWGGGNPYVAPTPQPFIYPLFLCVALWPLTQIPQGIAATIWFLLSVASIAVALAATGSLNGFSHQARRWTVAAAIVCVLLADVLQNNLRNGQVNLVVVGLCVLFAWCWARGRTWQAGAALGAAIAIKITPAILLLFLAQRRAWRAIVGAGTAAVVFAVVLPAAVAPFMVAVYYRYYAKTFLSERLGDPTYVASDPRTFNLAGVVHGLTGWSFAGDTLAFAALVAVGLLLFDRAGRAGSVGALCLYLSAVLLITPMSELHHLAFLIPGLAWLTWRALAGRSSMPSAAALAVVLLALLIWRYVPFAAFAGVAGTCALLVAAIRADQLPSPRT